MQINSLKKPIVLNKKYTKAIEGVASMPEWKTRLIIGGTGLAVKPATDYFVNRDLDKDTRVYSAGKAAAKVAIGTASGVGARWVGNKVGMKLGAKNVLSVLTTVFTILTLDIPIISKSLDYISDKLEPKKSKEGSNE